MTATPKPLPWFLTPCELAEMLRVSVRTLENWRLRDFGPPCIRVGASPHHRVVYDWHAVEAWLDQRKRP